MDEMMKKMAMQDQEMPDMPEDNDLQAKMEVLKELHDMASQLLGEGLDSPEEEEEVDEIEDPESMEQVTVMAKDQEGLGEGLDAAQSVLGNMAKKTGDFY